MDENIKTEKQPSESYKPEQRPPNPSSKPKLNNRYVLIAEILALIVFLGCISLLFINIFMPKQPNKVNSTLISTPTTAWKVFVGKGFEFKYPSQFTIVENKKIIKDSGDIPDGTISYEYRFSTGKLVNGQTDWSGFIIHVEPALGKKISQKYPKGKPNCDGTNSQNSGWIYTPLNQTENVDEAMNITGCTGSADVFRVGDNFFDIEKLQGSNLLADNSDDVNHYFSQILSTFKFTK